MSRFIAHLESPSYGRLHHRKRVAQAASEEQSNLPNSKPTTTSVMTTTSLHETSTTKTSASTTTTTTTTIATTTTSITTSTAAITTTTTTTTSASPSTAISSSGSTINDKSNPFDSSNTTGIIIGIVLGAAVVVLAAIGLLLKQRRNKRQREESPKQRTIGNNTNGQLDRSYSHRRVGPSYPGDLPAESTEKEKEKEKEDSETNNEHLTQQQEEHEQIKQHQPDWWSKKSPLEYFQQVPPMEEFYRKIDRTESTQHELQSNGEQSIHAAGDISGSEQTPVETAVNSREGTPSQRADRARRMAIHKNVQQPSPQYPPPSQRQRQRMQPQPRRSQSPIRPLSPIGSDISNHLKTSNEPRERKFIPCTYYPPPPVNISTNPYYRPPPPANFSAPSPGPFERRQEPTAQPSEGFYDSLEDEQFEGQDIPSTSSSSSRPAVPKATRPISINDPVMILMAMDQRTTSQSDQGYSTQTDQFMPSIYSNPYPSPPHSIPGILGGPWGVTPIPSSDSDISDSIYGSNEPRMGGRMPRLTRKSNDETM